MLARFKEVCDTVLTYRDHKDRLVRKNVIQVQGAEDESILDNTSSALYHKYSIDNIYKTLH